MEPAQAPVAEAAPAKEDAVKAEPAAAASVEEAAKPAEKGPRGVRVHVRNLGESATTEQLKELFQPYGEVIEAEAKTSEDGKCRGFGFVILPTQEEATKAVAEVNGKTVGDKEVLVVLPERKQKGTGKGKGKETKGESKGKGKGKAEGRGDAKGKGKGKGKGGQAAQAQGAAPGAYPAPYPYFYPPYGYGMYPNPYVYASMMGYPMNPAAYSPAAYQAAQAAAMQMWTSSMQSPTAGAQGAGYSTQPAAASTTAEGTSKALNPFSPGAKSAPKSKGKSKGKGKAAAESTADAQPLKEAPPPDKEFQGTLKSLSEKHGYGFIACAEAWESYGRDVWVDAELLPENAKVSARLLLNIRLSVKGHPQAQNVRVAP